MPTFVDSACRIPDRIAWDIINRSEILEHEGVAYSVLTPEGEQLTLHRDKPRYTNQWICWEG